MRTLVGTYRPSGTTIAALSTSTPATPNVAITSAVRRTYGSDTSGVVSSRRNPPARYGPISISAVRYWLDTSPAMATVPPVVSGPVTLTGRVPC
jgi:hypothetical protein